MAALVRHDTHTNSAAIAARGDTSASACFSRLLAALSYRHHVPGRLRLRFDELRSDPSTLETMRADIAAINGVRSAMANRLTGSIVVEYDRSTLPPSALSEALRERGIACDASTNRVGKQAIATSSLGHALGVAAERLLEWIVERLAITIIAAVI